MPVNPLKPVAARAVPAMDPRRLPHRPATSRPQPSAAAEALGADTQAHEANFDLRAKLTDAMGWLMEASGIDVAEGAETLAKIVERSWRSDVSMFNVAIFGHALHNELPQLKGVLAFMQSPAFLDVLNKLSLHTSFQPVHALLFPEFGPESEHEAITIINGMPELSVVKFAMTGTAPDTDTLAMEGIAPREHGRPLVLQYFTAINTGSFQHFSERLAGVSPESARSAFKIRHGQFASWAKIAAPNARAQAEVAAIPAKRQRSEGQMPDGDVPDPKRLARDPD